MAGWPGAGSLFGVAEQATIFVRILIGILDARRARRRIKEDLIVKNMT
jgi:hypothetical protein